jgi:hypothetical protein
MGEMRNFDRILVGTLEGKRTLKRPDVNAMIRNCVYQKTFVLLEEEQSRRTKKMQTEDTRDPSIEYTEITEDYRILQTGRFIIHISEHILSG